MVTPTPAAPLIPLALDVSGLTKTFRRAGRRGGVRALDGIELRIPLGTAFGLIGPNGAGKTTFIKTLLGIARPDAGQVKILDGDPDDPATRARIGYLPERLDLPAYLNPVDFLNSVSRLKGLTADPMDLLALLDRVGLSDSVRRKIGGFSKGMRQRLGLAAALLGRPDLLILDEPTDGVDPMGRIEIRDLLAAERRRGATIFLNSHLLAETERICDRIGVMVQGRIVRQGPLSDLCRTDGGYLIRVAAGSNEQALKEAGCEPNGEGWHRFSGDLAALNQAFDRLRAAGVLISDVRPTERDLESVLAEAMHTKGAS